MKSVVVFQHVPYEILGTFHPLLKKKGLRIKYINFSRHPDAVVDVQDYDGLIILGGPMGVYEADKFPHLKLEMEQIHRAITSQKPVLGICLGAQLIAATLGAEVKPAKKKEIGWFDIEMTDAAKSDPLFKNLDSKEKVFQWHGDNLSLPKGAVWLAQSPDCPYQAFRFEEKVYGFQFHLEVDEPMIERWLNVPSMRAELVQYAGEEAVETVKTTTHERIGRLKSVSDKLFSTYLDMHSAKAKPTRVDLGSGERWC